MATIDINKLIQESIVAIQSGAKSKLNDDGINDSLKKVIYENEEVNSDPQENLDVRDSSIMGIIGAGFGVYAALRSE